MNNKIEKLIKQFAKLPRVGARAAQRIVLALLQDKTGKAAALAAAIADAAENIRPCAVCGCLTDAGVGACHPHRGGLSGKAGLGGASSENLSNNFNNKNLYEEAPPRQSPLAIDTPPLWEGDARPLCEFCRDSGRANGQVCIVRDLGDVWTIEKSGCFRGRYHIIGGLISGANGTMPEDLNILTLRPRLHHENITEIIFALPNTIEGKTTEHYIINVVGARRDAPGAAVQPPLRFTELASGVPLGGDLDYIDDGTLSIAFGGRKAI